jgi:geranylgeranyl diphosphate synthase type II
MKSPEIPRWTGLIETELKRYFEKKDSTCSPLYDAMEYSLIAGGKRIRPLLVMMACHAAGGDPLNFIDLTIAVEMLHTYSLIHDDLPAMDDDDFRRGRQTNHKVFGEATAILAGDAMHSEAFEIILSKGGNRVSPEIHVALALDFCDSIGKNGMVAGQMMDLQAEKKEVSLEQLTLLHRRKTGALIRFCARMGGMLAQAPDSAMQSLTHYAETLGLLFQVVDDLLDRTTTREKFGKTPGKDLIQEKATFPKLLGEAETILMADRLLAQCHEILHHSRLETRLLRELTDFVRTRDY